MSSSVGRACVKGRNMNKGFKAVPASHHASDNLVVLRYRTARDFWNAEEAEAHMGYDNSEDDAIYAGSEDATLPVSKTTDKTLHAAY